MKAEQKAEQEAKEEAIKLVLDAKKTYEMEQMLKDQYVAERERFSGQYTTTKQEIKSLQAQLRNIQRIGQEKQESYRILQKEYQQKMNYLMYEYQNELTQRKTEFIVHVARELDELRTNEREEEIERRDAKERFKALDLDQAELFFREKLAHDREVSEIRNQHEMEVRELIQKYDDILTDLREEMENQRKREVASLNDAKRQQVTRLTEKHLEEFHRIKAYFNETTHQEHFTLIEQLKGQVSEKKKIEAAQRKMLNQTAAEAKKEEDPLKQAIEESERLKQRLQNWDQIKIHLAEAKSRESTLKAKLEQLNWEHEVLLQRCEQEEEELRDLKKEYEKEAYAIQQNALLHGMLLEKKLNKLDELKERKEAHLNELIAITDEGQAANRVTGSEMLMEKNAEISQLEDDLTKLTAVHREVIKFYEGKMQEYDIPFEELGFIPLIMSLAVPENHDQMELDYIKDLHQEVKPRRERRGDEVPAYPQGGQ
ncbi:putative Dynein regulatory complex subunit 4 [Blattamonas nauphoetae]|uniref:Dynein regulatory complex subunit 4 n=1 Tax=Blattamonas nauphoetae TaxID=2049346 RepID=A0ABQ9YI01_9EUKA|nr:putative Dynein regulatory complex subunit 4 [Blattamonas nauphoetae]